MDYKTLDQLMPNGPMMAMPMQRKAIFLRVHNSSVTEYIPTDHVTSLTVCHNNHPLDIFIKICTRDGHDCTTGQIILEGNATSQEELYKLYEAALKKFVQENTITL